MSETRPWTRIVVALALCLGFIAYIGASSASATPIIPNIKKVVHESQAAPTSFVPARAGWQGSEMPRNVQTSFDAAVTLRANKAALLTAALPDPRAVLAVIVVIGLMRLLRRIQEEQKQRQLATVVAIGAPDEERNAA